LRLLVRDQNHGKRDSNHEQTLMNANEIIKEFASTAGCPFVVGKFLPINKIRLAISLCYLPDPRLKFREWLDREQALDC